MIKLPKIRQINRKYLSLTLCILIALIFWMVRKLSEEHTISVPFFIQYEWPQGYSPSAGVVTHIDAELTARGWQLLSINKENEFLPLSVESESDTVFHIDERMLRRQLDSYLDNRYMSISRITPSNINVALLKTYQKTVPVVLDANINFYPDHDIRSPIIIEPDSVILYGPKEILDSLNDWKTEFFELNNVKANVEKIIKLKHPRDESTQLSHQSVILEMDVDEFTEKSFDLDITVIDANTGASVPNYKIIPNRARVFTIIPLSYYDDISREEFKLVVEVNSSDKTITERKQKLKLSLYPNMIKSFKIHPNLVDVFRVEAE